MKVKIRKLRDQDSNCCLPLGPLYNNIYNITKFRGGSRGGGAGGPGPPLSESLGIDFYSGYRTNSRYRIL